MNGVKALWSRGPIKIVMLLAAFFLVLGACTSDGEDDAGGITSSIAEERGFTQEQIDAALTTYMPSGEIDPYIMLASGGQSGQVLVIGVPSMRILKLIGVFTPEPWQGWGYGSKATQEVLDQGQVEGKEIKWGDTHHTALSETAGDYDGEFLFINDKANARVAVIDLRDFETKQIIKNPVAIVDHGGTKVTPNTEWVIQGGQYATPLGWDYAPISDYDEKYRGMVTFWRFDRDAGRLDESASFAMELPPYFQDLCDSGKLGSEGWVVCGSFNTERATGGIEEGNPPFEAGASAADFDYLHLINLEKAAQVAAAGNTVEVNGFPVIPLQTSIDEGLLYFIPEPKSPHGADVTPRGDYVVVSGKLAPNVTIFSFEKMFAEIEAQNWTLDPYGVPVLDFESVKEAQIDVGLGPLHTEFDNQGYAYTSLFLDSAVARWSLGPPYRDEWKLEGTVPVQYNIGHLAAAEGDTVSPDGNFLVAMNKWSLDRFFHPGPLLPQNFQLVDISGQGDDMSVLYDMPIGLGEPHYGQIIKADKLKPYEIYPEVGTDPATMEVDPNAPQVGNERVERDGDTVHVYMTAVRSHFTPERVEVKAGDRVVWHVTNVEQSLDATHGFGLPGYGINLSLEPGETATFEIIADADGVFPFYCTEFCSALHLEMNGYLLVSP